MNILKQYQYILTKLITNLSGVIYKINYQSSLFFLIKKKNYFLSKMTEQVQRSNEELVLSDTESEMEKENEAHTKSGRPYSGVWKHFASPKVMATGKELANIVKNSIHVPNQTFCVHILLTIVKMFLKNGVDILTIS
jgi:hypothetical protein